MKRDILRYGKLDTIPLARGYRMDERDPNAEYSQKDIEKMREELAESEWESLRNEDIQSILWDGCPLFLMMKSSADGKTYLSIHHEVCMSTLSKVFRPVQV
jgi:hypothetical protein